MTSNYEHQDSVGRTVVGITFLAVLAGLILPKAFVDSYVVLFGVLLILAGVPHGASDYFLFRQLTSITGNVKEKVKFFGLYLLIMVAYVLIWWNMSVIAFAMFLLISAYHFGQSNWTRVKFNSFISEFFTNLSWGAAIIGVPVLLHFGQASVIIQEMTGQQFILSDNWKSALIFLLSFGNIANIIHLYQTGVLSKTKFFSEIRNFFFLLLLFFTTPLLVGFGVYFVFWHSLVSTLDQIKVVRSVDKGFGLKRYLRATIPMSLMAFAGLAVLYYFFGHHFDQGQNLGILFLFVSVITVPHAVLMEWLYRVGGQVLKDDSG